MLAICTLAMSATPMAAHAQNTFSHYLTAAVRLYDALEYEQALEQLQQAKGLARDAEQKVTIALHEGIILADMGKREQSQTAFKTGLRLDPKAKLPLEVSPKIAHDFEEQRARVYQELASSLEESKQPAIAKTDRPEQLTEGPDLRVPAPVTPTPYATGVVEHSRKRVLVAPLVLAGVGIAAMGVGAVFGLQARSSVNDARRASFQDETHAHRDDAESSARVANVMFGTAGLAAVGALVTWALSPTDRALSKEVR
ncbi:tetratricopeptide repeat protein [Vitiosangium sp. GDMCC 1.1324]|uniref:tetratricopeptide repeat protein n=1 Tax=Vitiosangium sp. (strain GDMCC 1.1324) TaxID=2138576 RepID=UPI000D3C9F25|nr:tetratricopeptide repeat protein [Vitiosangium sp. GDMCC 1.1324]